MQFLGKLFSLFTPPEKRYLVYLLALMLFGACLDALGVGLILPVIAILSDPDLLSRAGWLTAYTGRLATVSYPLLVTATFFVLAGIYIAKNIYLTYVLHVQCRFVYDKQARTAKTLFEAYMRSPYVFHLARNSSELLLNVNSRVPDVLSSLLQIFGIIIETFVVVLILGLLLYVDWVSALGASGLIGASVYAFYKFTRRKISEYSAIMQDHSYQMIKLVQESFGAAKVVKLLGREAFFAGNYAKETEGFMKTYSYRQLVAQAPRYFIESCTIVGMSLIVFFHTWQGHDVREIMPLLALFGTAAFRLMPSLSKIVSGIAAVRFISPELDMIHRDLFELLAKSPDGKPRAAGSLLMAGGRPAAGASPGLAIEFRREIAIKDLTYLYPGTEEAVLKGINIVIPCGSSVAMVGHSGAGKSTLVDLIMGLLQPVAGAILVDGVDIRLNLRNWQDKIGYVPQDIYLCDDDIRRNVAFGIPDADIADERVWEVLRIARIDDFVAGLPEKLNTMVGERGTRLSGGQKQRLGIARALYHNPEVLVMDEATSSLDNETEIAIADSMDALTGEKTIIVIAHRTATRDRCQHVFTLERSTVANHTEN